MDQDNGKKKSCCGSLTTSKKTKGLSQKEKIPAHISVPLAVDVDLERVLSSLGLPSGNYLVSSALQSYSQPTLTLSLQIRPSEKSENGLLSQSMPIGLKESKKD